MAFWDSFKGCLKCFFLSVELAVCNQPYSTVTSSTSQVPLKNRNSSASTPLINDLSRPTVLQPAKPLTHSLARQCVLPAVPGALHRNVIILIIFSNSSSSFPLSSAGWRKKNPERSSFKCIILGLPTFLSRNLRARPPPRSVIGTLLAIFPRSCFKVRFLFASQIVNFFQLPRQSRFFSSSSTWSWQVAKRVLKIMLSYDSSSASVLPRASCPVVWVGSLLQGVGGFREQKKSCWKEFPYSFSTLDFCLLLFLRVRHCCILHFYPFLLGQGEVQMKLRHFDCNFVEYFQSIWSDLVREKMFFS